MLSPTWKGAFGLMDRLPLADLVMYLPQGVVSDQGAWLDNTSLWAGLLYGGSQSVMAIACKNISL